VLIGLVVTRDGYPLGYEIFAGNRHDSTTVQEIVRRMETRYGREQRIWVLDRGMVSDATLAWLQARGSRYIVGTPRARLKEFAEALRHGGWHAIRDGLEVQRCADTPGAETFILCRSAERAARNKPCANGLSRASRRGWRRSMPPVNGIVATWARSSGGLAGCWATTRGRQVCSASR
jgi:hypothetical protein